MTPNFSTAAPVDNYARFKSKYNEHVQAFKEKVDKLEQQNKQALKKPSGTPFHHPFNSDHHPLNFSSVKNAELFHDFVGPEQVSPHYENFMVARKFAIGFWAGLAVLSIGVSTVDIHWVMKSSFLPFFFWVQIMYFYLEGRKSFFKPLLVRFYRRIAANEIYNFEVFYHENVENKLRELIRISRSQMDYWHIHSQFQSVKAESINNFLVNEHLNLKNHINERAINVLTSAKNFEQMNQSKFVEKIVSDASAEIDNAIRNNAAVIQEQMMNVAIEALSKGYCDYQNDPILPLVQNSIKNSVAKVNALTAEQQLKLVALTEEQLNSIRNADIHARDEYLKTVPAGLDSMKNNESAKKILEQWGN